MKQNDKTYTNIFAIAFLAVTVFAFILYFVPEKQPLNWMSYDDALIVAAKKNKPILLNFYSLWSEECKEIDRNVFSNEKLKNQLKSKYILARIVLNNKLNKQLAKDQFDILGIPALIELTSKGKEVRRLKVISKEQLNYMMLDNTYKLIDSWQNFYSAKTEAESTNKILFVLLNTSLNTFNYSPHLLNDDKIKLLIAQDFVPTYLVSSNNEDRKVIKSLFGSLESAPNGVLILFYYKGKELDRYFISGELIAKPDAAYNKLLEVIKQKDSK